MEGRDPDAPRAAKRSPGSLGDGSADALAPAPEKKPRKKKAAAAEDAAAGVADKYLVSAGVNGGSRVETYTGVGAIRAARSVVMFAVLPGAASVCHPPVRVTLPGP